MSNFHSEIKKRAKFKDNDCRLISCSVRLPAQPWFTLKCDNRNEFHGTLSLIFAFLSFFLSIALSVHLQCNTRMWYSRTQYVNHSVFHFSFLLVHSHSHSHFQSRRKNVYQNDPRNWSMWSIKWNARQLQKKNKILSPQKCDGFKFMPLRSSTYATHMHHFNEILVPFRRFRIPLKLLLLLLFSVLLLLLMLVKLVFLFDNWKSITITDESEDARVSPNIIEHDAISQKMVFYFDWLKISNVSRIKNYLIISPNTHQTGCINVYVLFSQI